MRPPHDEERRPASRRPAAAPRPPPSASLVSSTPIIAPAARSRGRAAVVPAVTGRPVQPCATPVRARTVRARRYGRFMGDYPGGRRRAVVRGRALGDGRDHRSRCSPPTRSASRWCSRPTRRATAGSGWVSVRLVRNHRGERRPRVRIPGAGHPGGHRDHRRRGVLRAAGPRPGDRAVPRRGARRRGRQPVRPAVPRARASAAAGWSTGSTSAAAAGRWTSPTSRSSSACSARSSRSSPATGARRRRAARATGEADGARRASGAAD